jgi:hypothetical protein
MYKLPRILLIRARKEPSLALWLAFRLHSISSSGPVPTYKQYPRMSGTMRCPQRMDVICSLPDKEWAREDSAHDWGRHNLPQEV